MEALWNAEKDQFLEKLHNVPSSVYETLMSIKARKLNVDLHEESELETICNLIEVHSSALRNQALLCFDEILVEQTDDTSVNSYKDLLAIRCSAADSSSKVIEMMKKVEEMPEEWTIIQLTPQLGEESFCNIDNNLYPTSPLHLTVFRCGKVQPQPFTVTIDIPRDPVIGTKVELLNEMISIINTHKEVLCSVNKQKKFKDYQQKKEYLDSYQSVESRLKQVIQDFDKLWLKEWKCLLQGKYAAKDMEDLLLTEIEESFTKNFPELELNEKTKTLLCYIVKGSVHLHVSEMRRAIQYCFSDISDKLMRNVIWELRILGDKFMKMRNSTKRHPIILILHENLDCFPWEQLEILQDQPVSRLPSFHFLYYLFKEYENEIKDGYKIINNYTHGTYIVNPGMDLKNMEIRLLSFFNFWTPNWSGIFGYKPEKEEFHELLKSQIFSYNGHGCGSQYMSLHKIQKTKIKSVVLLFGCESVRTKREDAQVHMVSSHYAYLIARCPCIVGMLWVVTDTDTDVLTSDFLSYWVPSKAQPHWKYVNKAKWKMAEPELEFCKTSNNQCNEAWEPKLSDALNKAKKGLEKFITKAACVVRGLPVKIVSK